MGHSISMKGGFVTIVEQVAETLREGIRTGRWNGTIPGRNALAVEFGVNHKTVQSALAKLEAEGWIRSQGAGRERKILKHRQAKRDSMHVEILAYEESDFSRMDFLQLVRILQAAGHVPRFSKKTLMDLHMDTKRVADYVKRTDADAWVIVAGGREVLEWFTQYQKPAFALYGHCMKVPIPSAAPRVNQQVMELVDCLHQLGHRRIVKLVRQERRKPILSLTEVMFLEKLEAYGIPTGPYHLPDWEESPEGLQRCLRLLFKTTPPTALIVDDVALFFAVVLQIATMGLSIPGDVSVACTDYSPDFEWCHPAVTHIMSDRDRCIKQVIHWVDGLSKGVENRNKIHAQGKLILGGTIGPVAR